MDAVGGLVYVVPGLEVHLCGGRRAWAREHLPHRLSVVPSFRRRFLRRQHRRERRARRQDRSEEHTSELQSRLHLVCRLLLEKKKKKKSIKLQYIVLPDSD